MNQELRITFKGMRSSDAVRAHVEKQVERLERRFPRLAIVRVALETPQRHLQGGHYLISISMSLRGTELVVSRDPPFDAVREDLHAAIDDAFATANRIAEDHLKKVRERRRGAAPAPVARAGH